MKLELNKQLLNDITYEVIGSAIEVHKSMGRGLLESVYLECMKEGKYQLFIKAKI